ncbi:hypothetical protein TEA_013548 [Camellia sinensis var. sinensis]|uniref:Isopenicillin N synthase-like Fe(2+) 2OG dioxygenase domain-containing protein n=1 Tax=Camellia sinensis var. sinensis TaxID=542762 RepID=A0A4S4EM00_CAMSN|nr:hypothetical protein TEA_013548 [Camellia sinensis var. sinensis]
MRAKNGCFRIINHQIPTTLMSDMKSVVRSLLDLPPEIKRRNTDVIAGSGYVAPNMVNPLYEGLGLYDIGSTHVVLDFCTQLDASPQQSEMDEDLYSPIRRRKQRRDSDGSEKRDPSSRHRDTILRYSQSIHKLAMDIGNKLAQSMGLASDLFMGWPCQFRINKYSFTPETLGSSGVQIHTDSAFLTILQDDENVGGLEVMDKKSGEFVPVDPMPGTLLVNLGDFATVGPKEAPLEAPPELVDSENHPRLHVPINFEDYRKLQISTGLRAGEALDKLSASNVPF